MYFLSLGVKGLTWFVTNQYVLRSCIQKAPYIDTKIHPEIQWLGREACRTMAKDNSMNNFFFHEKIVTTQSICMFCVLGDTVWSYNPANSNACGGFGSCVWSAMLHTIKISFSYRKLSSTAVFKTAKISTSGSLCSPPHTFRYSSFVVEASAMLLEALRYAECKIRASFSSRFCYFASAILLFDFVAMVSKQSISWQQPRCEDTDAPLWLVKASTWKRDSSQRLFICFGSCHGNDDTLSIRSQFAFCPVTWGSLRSLHAGKEMTIIDNGEDETQLHAAARLNNIELVRQALGDGFDVNAVGISGWTPVHEVASSGNCAILRLLLRNGGDPNIQDHLDKCSSLHLAARNGHLDAVKLLVRNGARLDLRNAERKTPQEVAEEDDCIDYLERKREYMALRIVDICFSCNYNPTHVNSNTKIIFPPCSPLISDKGIVRDLVRWCELNLAPLFRNVARCTLQLLYFFENNCQININLILPENKHEKWSWTLSEILQFITMGFLSCLLFGCQVLLCLLWSNEICLNLFISFVCLFSPNFRDGKRCEARIFWSPGADCEEGILPGNGWLLFMLWGLFPLLLVYLLSGLASSLKKTIEFSCEIFELGLLASYK